MPWSQRFAEPIVLPDGAKLATLSEAVAHLGKVIPKSHHDLPAVVTAAKILTSAAEHGGPIEVRAHCVTAGAQSSPCPAIHRWQGSALEAPKLAREKR